MININLMKTYKQTTQYITADILNNIFSHEADRLQIIDKTLCGNGFTHGCMYELDQKILIIEPNTTAVIGKHNSYKQQSIRRKNIGFYCQDLKGGVCTKDYDVIVTTQEQINIGSVPESFLQYVDVIVIDEVHKVYNESSGRKSLRSLYSEYSGKEKINQQALKKVFGVTATPLLAMDVDFLITPSDEQKAKVNCNFQYTFNEAQYINKMYDVIMEAHENNEDCNIFIAGNMFSEHTNYLLSDLIATEVISNIYQTHTIKSLITRGKNINFGTVPFKNLEDLKGDEKGITIIMGSSKIYEAWDFESPQKSYFFYSGLGSAVVSGGGFNEVIQFYNRDRSNFKLNKGNEMYILFEKVSSEVRNTNFKKPLNQLLEEFLHYSVIRPVDHKDEKGLTKLVDLPINLAKAFKSNSINTKLLLENLQGFETYGNYTVPEKLYGIGDIIYLLNENNSNFVECFINTNISVLKQLNEVYTIDVTESLFKVRKDLREDMKCKSVKKILFKNPCHRFLNKTKRFKQLDEDTQTTIAVKSNIQSKLAVNLIGERLFRKTKQQEKLNNTGITIQHINCNPELYVELTNLHNKYHLKGKEKLEINLPIFAELNKELIKEDIELPQFDPSFSSDMQENRPNEIIKKAAMTEAILRGVKAPLENHQKKAFELLNSYDKARIITQGKKALDKVAECPKFLKFLDILESSTKEKDKKEFAKWKESNQDNFQSWFLTIIESCTKRTPKIMSNKNWYRDYNVLTTMSVDCVRYIYSLVGINVLEFDIRSCNPSIMLEVYKKRTGIDPGLSTNDLYLYTKEENKAGRDKKKKQFNSIFNIINNDIHNKEDLNKLTDHDKIKRYEHFKKSICKYARRLDGTAPAKKKELKQFLLWWVDIAVKNFCKGDFFNLCAFYESQLIYKAMSHRTLKEYNEDEFVFSMVRRHDSVIMLIGDKVPTQLKADILKVFNQKVTLPTLNDKEGWFDLSEVHNLTPTYKKKFANRFEITDEMRQFNKGNDNNTNTNNNKPTMEKVKYDGDFAPLLKDQKELTPKVKEVLTLNDVTMEQLEEIVDDINKEKPLNLPWIGKDKPKPKATSKATPKIEPDVDVSYEPHSFRRRLIKTDSGYRDLDVVRDEQTKLWGKPWSYQWDLEICKITNKTASGELWYEMNGFWYRQ